MSFVGLASSNFPWNDPDELDDCSFQISAPDHPVSHQASSGLLSHKARESGPKAVIEDKLDKAQCVWSLHISAFARRQQVYADFHLWILRWFPISCSYSVPYWFPLSQANSHFGCGRLYWHQSSASCNWYVVCSSSAHVIPCASLRVVSWSVLRDAWLNIWPNFCRILRKERHRRQVSVNRCHTSFKPWADWKEMNTSMRQNAKRIWIIFVIQSSTFCIGILRSGIVAEFEIAPKRLEGWVG